MPIIPGTENGDILSDTAGDDTITALGGIDTITVAPGGTDSVDGGADNDRLILDARVTGGGITMVAPAVNADGLSGSASWTSASVSFQRIENFTPGHNLLTVDNNTKIDFTNVERLHLIGSAPVDNVTGLVGDDILEGRAGNDTLSGGTGNDQLTGGADDDTFIIINGDDSDNGVSVFQLAAPPSTAPALDLDASGAGTGFASAFTEDGAAAAIADSDVAIVSNGGQLTGATITVADARPGDTLTLAGALAAGITATGLGTASLTLSGAASNADYQAALALVRYASTSEHPTAGGHDTRSIDVVVSDANGASNTATAIVAVTAVHVGVTTFGSDNYDYLQGGIPDDQIFGLGGDDYLIGGDGSDLLDGGDGNDSLQGGLSNDTLIGGEGNDFLNDTAGANALDGGSGNDVLQVYDAGAGQWLSGGDGADSIYLAGSNSIVLGGAGDDSIQVYGSGNRITGGTGVDTYQANTGGANLITDFAAGDGGDVLDLSQLLSSAQGYSGPNPFASGHIRAIQSGADTLLQFDYNGSAPGQSFTTAMTLAGVTAASLTAFNFGGYHLDGTPAAGQTLTGTGGNDNLTGTIGADQISGLGGHDELAGGDANDQIDGGDGNDRIDGGFGNDNLIGGAGDDTLNDSSGVNSFDGGAGNDTLSSYSNAAGQTMSGGDGDDLLQVYSGGSSLTGGAGRDTYRLYPYGGGGGNVITDFTAGPGGDRIDVLALLDYASGYAGPSPFATGHLRVVQSGADVLLQFDSDGATNGAFFSTLATLTGVTVSSLTADNFSGYNPDGSATPGETITGTANGETLNGTVGDDLIYALEGNDVVNGGDGSDRLEGGAGRDRLDGGYGNDTLIGGDDNDELSDQYGVNSFDGGAGDDYISSSSYAAGQTISGGEGSDIVYLYGTNSTVSGDGGDDSLQISGTGNSVSGGTGSDRFSISTYFYSLATGTTITDFAVGQGGDNLDIPFMLQNAAGYNGPNPFGTGYLRLVQSGADTLVQWDQNGGTGGANYVTLVTLTGVQASSIRPANVSGYNADGSASPPVGANQNVSGTEDTILSGQAVASDVDSFSLTYTLATGPSHGTIDFETDGSYVYTPFADYYGLDSFTFTASDGALTSDPATISINLASVADAVADSANVDEDGSVVIDMLDNDQFETAPSLVSVTQGTHGTVVIEDNGTPLDALDDYVTYTPDADYNGADSFTYTASAGGVTETQTVNVQVAAVNDAPTLTATGLTPTFTEGNGFHPLFSGAAASTVEAGQTVTSMTLTVSNVTDGADELLAVDGTAIVLTDGFSVVTSGGNSLSVSVTVAGNVATVTFSGAALSVAQVQSLVEGFAYSNSSQNPTDADRVVTITRIVDSGPNGGADVNNSNPNISATVNVEPVNDAPLNTVPGAQTINEDGNVVFSTANGNAIQVADADATTLTVTLTVEHGTLTLVSNAGLTFSGGSDGMADMTMTFSGTAAAINAALGAGLSYVPTANYNGPDSIAVLTADAGESGSGGTRQDEDTIAITINSVNEAPQGSDKTITGSEDDPYVFTVADFGFSDPVDGDDFLAVIIDSFPANGTLFIDYDGAGGNPPLDISTVGAGVFVSVDDINAGRFYFQPDADEFGDGYASFTFRVQDDGGMANGGVDRDPVANTITINLTPDNVAPVVDLNGGTAGIDDTNLFVEGSFPAGLGTDIVVTDGNGDDIVRAVVTITDAVAGDTLVYNLPLPAGITVDPASTATTLILVGAASASAYSTALGQVGFTSTSDNPTLGGTDTARSITLTVNDGTVDSAPATMTLTVAGTNDAPTSTGLEGDLITFTEGDAAGSGQLDVGDNVTISDLDSANFDGGSLTLRVSGNKVATEDQLFFTANTNPAAPGLYASAGNLFYSGTLIGTYTLGGVGLDRTFTFNANATPAMVQELLRGVSYYNANQADPSTAQRTIEYVLTDGDGGTTTLHSLVNVVDVNDVPVNNVPGAQAIDEDQSVTLGSANGNAISVTDVDADSLTVTLSVAHGTLTLASLTGLSFTAGDGGADATMTFSGSVAAINAALAAGLTYTPDANYNGSDAITIVSTDNGETGAGGIGTDTDSVEIAVGAIDDAAVAQPDAFTINENGAIVGGNLFADNGSGADADTDGPPLAISAVNGSAGNVNTTILLASGASLTVNSNGTFSYDPGTAFLPTPTSGSGASNTPGQDSFTYTLAGGNTVTVNITLTGLDTDDTLLGTAGSDILMGGNGNDTYFVENGFDQVIEAAGGGSDYVVARTSYVLGAGTSVELLSTDNNAGTAAIDLTGNELANVLVGNAGANWLDGGSGGADLLVGLGGNDTYFVDADDRVLEDAGQGYDYVVARTSYALGAGVSVELLSTDNNAGIAAIDLTGNELANIVVGNAGANWLDGGSGGADLLRGLGGDDIYFVDADDRVLEDAGQGYDYVVARTSYALGAGTSVELLSTDNNAGTAAINLTGNELANILVGNAGANWLDGGSGGADLLRGLGGDDTYFVDADDRVLEDGGQGYDYVVARTSYALGAGVSVELLSTDNNAGTAAINLTGNELANILVGNAGANTLDGGAGSDVLVGLAGADTFAFTTALGAGNVDTITDFLSGTDRIALDDAVFTGIGGLGTLNAGAFVTGSQAADADDRIIYNSANGQLLFDADGAGGTAAVHFATLATGLTLSAGDFMVI